MHSVLKFLCVSVPRFALGTMISIGVVINVANVAGRYLFNSPIIWAEEILVFIMIGCVFLGAILVTWEGQHIRMDMLSVRLGRPWRSIVLALDTLVFVLVCLFVIYHSWHFVQLLYETGQSTVVARLPAWLMHGAILAGFTGMLLVVFARVRNYLTGDFGPQHGLGMVIDEEPAAAQTAEKMSASTTGGA